MILDSCRYMNGMLSSLLVTYRNYGKGINLEFEEFSLLELVEECVSEMIYVAKDKGVNIIINTAANIIDNKGVNLCADKVQIKRVVMNLLSNGIKYAYKNTDLQLMVYIEKGYANFQFENKSPYITEEKQKTIFARYVSYAGMHKELGIGLGLYASKKIIEAHSGNIYVKSFKENRNIFGFSIPVKQEFSAKKEIFF